MRFLLILFAATVCAFGVACTRADPEKAQMARELAQMRREVKELKEALEAHRKEVEQTRSWYQEMAPRLEAFRREAEEFERRAERFTALARGEATEQAKAMIADVVKELDLQQRRRRAERQRDWLDDFRVRTLEELAAVADLSPEQKRQIQRFESEEREEVHEALVRFGPPKDGNIEGFRQILEQARLRKEEKVSRVLDHEQFRKYKQFYAQGFGQPRGGYNRRIQSPERDQDDF